MRQNFRFKYTNNIGFCEKEKARLKTHILGKYQKNMEFRHNIQMNNT
jgi:hypothetical protein